MKDKKTIIIGVIAAIVAIVLIILLLKGCGAKEFTVTFNSNGGSAVSSQTVKDGESATKPSNPTREGYEFAGWYLNLNDTVEYDFSAKVTKDITLYAKWAEATVGKDNLSLSSSSLELTVGDTHTLEAILPDGLSLSDLVWSSSDDGIVKVSSNGKLTAIKAGNATITVKSIDGKYSATCLVSVKDKENVSVKSLKISGSKSVTVGSTITLKAVFTPTDASNKKVTWKSSNSKIATVDANGRVKGIAPGKVTITACSQENKDICASISITVNAKSVAKPVSVTGITVNKNNVSLYVGDSDTVTATVTPNNASNKNVKWTVKSGDNVVSVSNGKITGKAAGSAVVEVCTEDGNKCATITVTVKDRYAITFTAVPVEFGEPLEYTMTLTKNGNTFTSYSIIKYNGYSKPFKDKYVTATNINKSATTASIVLNDGTEITNVPVAYR